MNYKHAESSGWYYQIDDQGNRGQSWTRKNRPKMYEEMQDWVKEGNTIEPRFTPEELLEKEVKDSKNALDSQKSICIQLLNDSEKSVSRDPPYPSDFGQWVIFRKELRDILKREDIVMIPEKPF